MEKIAIFKTQHIGGNRPQFMQSIGFGEAREAQDKPTRGDDAEQNPTPILSDADWIELYDDEIGYWESIRPFWF